MEGELDVELDGLRSPGCTINIPVPHVIIKASRANRAVSRMGRSGAFVVSDGFVESMVPSGLFLHYVVAAGRGASVGMTNLCGRQQAFFMSPWPLFVPGVLGDGGAFRADSRRLPRFRAREACSGSIRPGGFGHVWLLGDPCRVSPRSSTILVEKGRTNGIGSIGTVTQLMSKPR